ncbi:MAG: PASTA domain-containing protein [Candidatus Syntrophopropionicum ammoniitolerans]
MSPEQARGGTADARSDIYSLGIVLYEMATGILPFTGETPVGVAMKHIQESPAPPATINPAIALELERVITRAMAKNPADRYQTAQDMAADLLRPRWREANWAWKRMSLPPGVIPTVHRVPEGRPSPEYKKNKRKKRPPIFWLELVLLISVIAATGVFWYYVNVPEINMPNVAGKTEAEAREILKDQGIENILVSHNLHPTVPQGLVVSQDPKPDTKIKITRTVTLSVSMGQDLRECRRLLARLFTMPGLESVLTS